VSRQPPIRIGARGSKLSLAQSGLMQARIAHALGVPIGASQAEIEAAAPLIPIVTTGDRIQDRRLMEIGGKGLFTKEIEEALLDGRIDCAVHSLKDMPAELPPGLCWPPRPSARTRATPSSATSPRGWKTCPRARAWAPPRCVARPRPCTCGRTSKSSCCAAMSTPAWPSWSAARPTPSCWPSRA
jgi:hypothetical protein